MHLSYRGIRYQSQANQLPVLDNNQKGNYRGISYNIHRIKNTTSQQCFQLKYRGVNYKSCIG
ncbi:hypothetical protein CEN40_17700 [Fischerella thermalis CCMEE 5205]|uniref:DUF4278 domain-containing protein n=1 Tax=Fischerella thermalis CCMEE 5318 TaxID=2019666 RepID=A0A2N6LPK1_9CYAN|nr:DUF4278 domain-containing protein [Fischerella thermalis]PMB07916.1 hypothetical protein CI592_08565 [Fischerella thermalis CCMEE 5328]PMB27774.1 hypothetical protein CEN46_00720 [Fischerella thermalis CCMEE 5318]PMB42610.1 hypothetical protein CEN40_17700 [Fischerella thermalis CCMEE 5205]